MFIIIMERASADVPELDADAQLLSAQTGPLFLLFHVCSGARTQHICTGTLLEVTGLIETEYQNALRRGSGEQTKGLPCNSAAPQWSLAAPGEEEECEVGGGHQNHQYLYFPSAEARRGRVDEQTGRLGPLAATGTYTRLHNVSGFTFSAFVTLRLVQENFISGVRNRNLIHFLTRRRRRDDWEHGEYS